MDFDEYVAAHGSELVRLGYVLTGDPHLAEDLAQTTLAKMYRSWARIRAVDDPAAYGRKACLRTYLSWRRRMASRELVRPDIDHERSAVDPADEIAERIDLHRLLDQITPRARAALVLRYYLDLSDDDIAAAISARPATVRSLIHRGLKAARESMHSPARPSTKKEVPDARRR